MKKTGKKVSKRAKKVWVAVIEHRHGQNVYAAATREKLDAQLYDYVEGWWESELGEKMPVNRSKREVIDRYFEVVSDETLDVMTQVEVAQ